MHNSGNTRKLPSAPMGALFAALALVTLFFARTRSTSGAGQGLTSSAVAITPSALSMLVNDSESLSVVDSTGLPIKDAEWSISPSIANLTVENGEATVHSLRQGRAIITASTEHGPASAAISILSGSKFPPTTVQWSLEPPTASEPLMTLQIDTTEDPVPLHSTTRR